MKFEILESEMPLVQLMYLCSLRPSCRFYTKSFGIAYAYHLNQILTVLSHIK